MVARRDLPLIDDALNCLHLKRISLTLDDSSMAHFLSQLRNWVLEGAPRFVHLSMKDLSLADLARLQGEVTRYTDIRLIIDQDSELEKNIRMVRCGAQNCQELSPIATA